MLKPKLEYTVRTTRAPGEQTDTWVPSLVERLQPTGLDSMIERCIDRGLIAGLKPTAAKTIADGVAEQIAYELTQGRGIQFGQYFYGRPYLSGKVDANGNLTADNAINVRLYKGNAFKLSTGDFSLAFADGGNNPVIDSVLTPNHPRGEIDVNGSVVVNGRMLWAAGDTVKVKFVADSGTVAAEATVFTSTSSDLLTFACPDGLASNTKYNVVVERTDTNGVTRTSAPKAVTAKSAS